MANVGALVFIVLMGLAVVWAISWVSALAIVGDIGVMALTLVFVERNAQLSLQRV